MPIFKLCHRRGCIREAGYGVVLVMPLEAWDSNPDSTETPFLVCHKHKENLTVQDVMPPDGWVVLTAAWKKKHGQAEIPAYENLRLDFKELQT